MTARWASSLLGTLRGRLILGVALVHAALMSLFVVDLVARQRAALLERQEEGAVALSRSLATAAASWLASQDVSGLAELVEAERGYPELLYAILADERGHVLAHTERDKVGKYLLDLPEDVRPAVIARSVRVVDVATPALVAGKHVGWARVGVSQRNARARLAAATRSGALYAVAAILIGSAIAWIMGRQITRRLYAVQDTIGAVRSGRREARCAIAGGDEAAAIAREVNVMLDALDRQQAALAGSESRYRLLLRSLRTAVLVVGPDARVRMANPMALEALGAREAQALGRDAGEPGITLLREDGSPMPLEERPVMRVLASRAQVGDVVMGVRRPDSGDVAWFLVNASPLLDARGELAEAIETALDITRRKGAEEALRERHSTLRGILDGTPALIFSVDAQGRYTSFNRAHAQVMKALYGAEIAPGQVMLDAMTVPADRAQAARNLARALAGEQVVEEAYSGEELRSRQYFRVSHSPIRAEDGAVIGAVVLAQDLTERRRAEEALRRANRELEAIRSCHAVLVRAEDEGALLRDVCHIVCEEAGYRMTCVGYVQDDAARSVLPVAWAGAEADDYLAHANLTWAETAQGSGPAGRAIRTGRPAWTQDFEGDDAVAPWRERALPRGYRSCIALPLRNHGGRVFGLLAIYSSEVGAFTPEEIRLLEALAADLAFGISVLRVRAARRRAEEEVRTLNAELERRVAERTAQLEAANEELESFAYSVSHDLRAPLRHIDGYLGLLRQRSAAALDARSLRNMDAASDAARRMGALIDDLLAFARMRRAEMDRRPVPMRELVEEVVRELAPEAAGRAVRWRVGDLPAVAGDRTMLRVVLVNLLANALKFTRARAQAEIEVGALPPAGGEAVLFVRDNGVGFDPQYVDRLFGVFQRLHRAEDFEGTGIGLASVRRIVRRHGGRTWAEGELDGGATFYFSLPLAQEARPRVPQAAR